MLFFKKGWIFLQTFNSQIQELVTFRIFLDSLISFRYHNFQSSPTKDESHVKLILKDKILNRQAVDKKKSPFESRQISAPIGQGVSTNQKATSSLSPKGKQRFDVWYFL